MSDDYAKATAAPGYISIGETQYRPKKFGPRDIGDLESYLKREFPDPRLMARELCAGLPDAVALKIWTDLSEQAKDWPVAAMSSKGSYQLMFTWEGNANLAWVALRRYQADVTLDRARQITADATTDEIAELIRACFPEDSFTPKSPASPAPE
jgi:hypothetical protein